MTPEPLVQPFWDDLNRALLFLALLHLAIVSFAGSILVARALIPSLVYTGHAPERLSRLQPVFYALAALIGLGVLTVAFLWISNLGFLTDIYDRSLY